jgi:hypothetical protein
LIRQPAISEAHFSMSMPSKFQDILSRRKIVLHASI